MRKDDLKCWLAVVDCLLKCADIFANGIIWVFATRDTDDIGWDIELVAEDDCFARGSLASDIAVEAEGELFGAALQELGVLSGKGCSAGRYDIGNEVINQELQRTQQLNRKNSPEPQQKADNSTSLDHLTTLLLTWPEHAGEAVQHCDPHHLPVSQGQKLYKIIFDAYNAADVLDPEQIFAQLETDEVATWQQRSMLLLEKTATLQVAGRSQLIIAAAHRAQRDGILQKLDYIKQQQLTDTENLALAQQAAELIKILHKVDTR